jgi:hypothetical protein
MCYAMGVPPDSGTPIVFERHSLMTTKSPVRRASKAATSKLAPVTVWCPKSEAEQITRELKGEFHCGFCGETGHFASLADALAHKLNTPVAKATLTVEDRKGMSFTYEETEFPESTKAAKTATPNPHTSGVAAAIAKKTAGDVKGLGFKLANDEKEINRHKAWLRSAGNTAGVTIRIEVVPVEGDDQSVKLVFRAVDKITRTRKASIAPDVAAPATPAEAGF